MGGPAGDLFVEIRVKQHPHFERRGEDLFAELSVPYVQMLLGAEVEVPTVTGKASVEIPRGVHDGDNVKVPNEGFTFFAWQSSWGYLLPSRCSVS